MCPPSRGRQRNGGGGAEVEAGGGSGGGGPFADVGRGKAIIKMWTQFWSSHQVSRHDELVFMVVDDLRSSVI